MKYSVFSAIFIIVFSLFHVSQAQEPRRPKVIKELPKLSVGLKFGANFNTLTGQSWNRGYGTGLVGGAFADITKKKAGIHADLLFRSTRLAADNASNYTTLIQNARSVYLDVPVLFGYRLLRRLWVQAGPQFSLLLSANQGGSAKTSIFKPTECSGVAGLQLNLRSTVTLGVRYILGFTNINKETLPGSTEAWNSRAIQVCLSLTIFN